MDKLLEGVGNALSTMPPAWAAIVILALAALALVYVWRKAGEEAKSERAKAEAAKAAGSEAQMGHVISALDGVSSSLERIERALAVLIDRGSRK